MRLKNCASEFPIPPFPNLSIILNLPLDNLSRSILKKVSVITVNFNQPLVTEQFLSSVFRENTYSPIEIIVVDNGSKNDHTKEWQAKFNDVIYLRSEKNLGFAGGNNLGIARATGDYLFFVNNDTEFTPGLIKKLADILDENPKAGIVSPKICYFDEPNKIQYAGFTEMNFNTGRNKCMGQYEIDKGQFDNSTGPTGYAHGAAMMVRKDAIDKAGPMPENFFLYYEEMDWCEKIKRCGYEIWVEPKATIYHKESISVGKKSPLKEYFMTRNRMLFIRRNAAFPSKVLFFFHFLLLVAPRNLALYIRQKRPDLARQFLKSVWWNITHGKNSKDLGYEM